MTTIGTFRRDGQDFVGRLSTLMIDASLRLTAVEKVSASAPVFRAFVGEAECGAAWRPTDPASGALLNVKLDDPTWPEPIHARLMAGEETCPLVWIRRQDERAKEQAPAPDPKSRAAPA
ncbi:DUF736 domain-containing protein [Caulobacter flavus]|jgi:hypothetical protein|uniref:DUF736 domain-containing protein n=1 Tax=Caulobacter flavus TaxID=1679497 RepID=A0A2N5CQ93_9CAUL|nr:DUF736 domain-containing protein [Caulobacter flavus]AYV46261.1 DUF736 domain-containing protein [Caulobacter flavus]PLR09981.1 DUF736 domain-containing protein [Caulobacter flavus]